MEFEWDDEKAESNYRKHAVRFTDAVRAFDDPNAVLLLDESNSDYEIRYQLIGLTSKSLLFIAFTERLDTIRIISARKANKQHTKIYDERKK